MQILYVKQINMYKRQKKKKRELSLSHPEAVGIARNTR